ncbi:uncharacterized protein LOC105430332 [Pogonomyrmex barbatus]|uniref:Uncharacterized protein LOC105430332 n=1 Tax=Pogonomyrmex barbatus TaxID=144034 RepID=A0A6I9WH55_9HYME|nr:uncharacterized protein LOC105430332 [Pogonomyrmex barbatus]
MLISAVADEPSDTVTQLSDLLNSVFGSVKSVVQYRGELIAVHLRPNEHILDYIDRVKEIRSAIRDGQRRARGILNPAITQEIDEITAQCFCEGLSTPYRLQLQPEYYHAPFEAFAAAKIIAKRDEIKRQCYSLPARLGQPPPQRPPNTPRRSPEPNAWRNSRYRPASPPGRRRTHPRFDEYSRERNYSLRPECPGTPRRNAINIPL